MKYLINGNMKALRRGDFVKADEKAKEFIYDSAAPDTPEHNVAVMRGIADANNIVIPSNMAKRGDIARRLSSELEKLNLPEVKSMTQTEQATKIIEDGVKADKTDDQILVDMVNSGIGFKVAGRMFKQIMEEKGFRVSAKTRQEQGFDILKKMKFKPNSESWETVEPAIEKLMEGVPDTNEQQAIAVIRKYAKANELVLPKAPPKAKGGKGKAAIQDYMVKNPLATKAQFTKFMSELGKNETVIARNWEWFEVGQKMIKSAANAADAKAAK